MGPVGLIGLQASLEISCRPKHLGQHASRRLRTQGLRTQDDLTEPPSTGERQNIAQGTRVGGGGAHLLSLCVASVCVRVCECLCVCVRACARARMCVCVFCADPGPHGPMALEPSCSDRRTVWPLMSSSMAAPSAEEATLPMFLRTATTQLPACVNWPTLLEFATGTIAPGTTSPVRGFFTYLPLRWTTQAAFGCGVRFCSWGQRKSMAHSVQ